MKLKIRRRQDRDILHTLFDLVAMNISFVICSFVFYRTLLSPCLRMLYCLNDLAQEMVAEETLMHLLGRMCYMLKSLKKGRNKTILYHE